MRFWASEHVKTRSHSNYFSRPLVERGRSELIGLRYTMVMDRLLTTIPAHYDGENIQLDVPIALEPNARLLVTILAPAEPTAELVYAMMSASAASLARIWDNDEDAVYDAY